ncbi:MAG: CbiX/SirB N-terminal domain-containing protein [Verrucomicrobiales bacterium]
MHNDLRNVALILVGHGSTTNKESSQPLRQVVAQLRARSLFGETLEALWKESPSLHDAAQMASKQKVVIVPFFISEGYFSCQVAPETFGFPPGENRFFRQHPQYGAQEFIYAKPVGTHPAITAMLLRLAEDVVSKHPFPRAPKPADISLFIAGHGTPKDPKSREAIEHQAQAIRGLNRYAMTQAIYIEEEPKIDAFDRLAMTKNVVVVPFFTSNGMHTAEDIPRMLGEAERVIKTRLQTGLPTWRNPSEKRGKLVWYAKSIGEEPQMLEIVIARAREALGAGSQ